MYSKYRNKKVEIGNKVFDSKKEADRFVELSIMENCGQIENLKTQVEFLLIPKTDKFRAVKYIADFEYTKDGKHVVEDVKGYRKGVAYSLFKIKQKLMYYYNKIEVIEI